LLSPRRGTNSLARGVARIEPRLGALEISPMPSVRILNRRVPVPGNRAARTALGGGLVAGGVFGFLPVLGFWMIPAGLIVLAVDSARVRRFNRRATVRIVRAWNSRKQKAETPGA
jgi:hypothetical protein